MPRKHVNYQVIKTQEKSTQLQLHVCVYVLIVLFFMTVTWWCTEDTVKPWLCSNMPGPVLSVCCILFYFTFLSTPQMISLQYDSPSKKSVKTKSTLKKEKLWETSLWKMKDTYGNQEFLNLFQCMTHSWISFPRWSKHFN